MNSNTACKGIKGDQVIEKEAEDSVPSKSLGTLRTFNCFTSFSFKLNIHSLSVFRNNCQIVSNKIGV